MPSLSSKLETIRITLPSFGEADPAWVEIKKQVLTGDVLDTLESVGSSVSPYKINIHSLVRLIVDWNFIDEQTGEKTPITLENVRKIPVTDLNVIQEKMNDQIDVAGVGIEPEKKDDSSSSLPTT